MTKWKNITKRAMWTTTILLVLVTVILGYFASKTQIDMGTYTLLPTSDPTVEQFNIVSKKFGGFDNLILLITGEESAETERAIGEIAEELMGLNTFVKNVEYRVPITFFEDNWIYYADDESFNEIVDMLDMNPATLSILGLENNLSVMESLLLQEGDGDAEELGIKLRNMQMTSLSLNSLSGIDLSNGYYYLEDSKRYMMVIRPVNPDHDMLFFTSMVGAVEDALKEIKLPGDLDVEITGMAKMMEEQQKSLNLRIAVVTIVTLLLISIMFTVAYGRVLAALFAAIPVVVGIIWTLGVNYLVIGRLNLITSIFSIIMLGLGIDFSIHFMTPILETDIKPSDRVAYLLKGYLRSITMGALTTATAFFSLGFSKFIGLKELAFVAGTGIILTFASVLIFIIAYSDKISTTKEETSRKSIIWTQYFAILSKQRVIITIIFVVIVMGIPLAGLNLNFNYNAFSLLPPLESVVLQEELIKELGISLEYSIIESESIDEVRSIAEDLVRNPKIGNLDAITNYIPSNQSYRIDKLRELYNTRLVLSDEIKTQFNSIRTKQPFGLSEESSDDISRMLQSLAKGIMDLGRGTDTDVISISTLPESITDKYVSKDGQIATFVYGNPNSWEEDEMKDLVNVISTTSQKASGTPFMWVKIVDYLREDLVFGSVIVASVLFILVWLDFKKIKYVLLVIIPVTVGALLLLKTMSVFNIQFNAANIAALPLIIGIGIDDGIHMMHKYLGIAKGDVLFMLRTTGKSVVITSLTTMIGFGGLVFVKDPLVSGLGQLLFMGVFYCLIASVVVLPAILLVVEKYTKIETGYMK